MIFTFATLGKNGLLENRPVGSTGDFYLKTTNPKVLYKKTTLAWVEITPANNDVFTSLDEYKSYKYITNDWVEVKPYFVWVNDNNAEEKTSSSVKPTKFGDGYEQRVKIGINTQQKSWNLTFTADAKTILQIRDFLNRSESTNSFQWMTPFQELDVFISRGHTIRKVFPEVLQLSTEFERLYEANVLSGA